MPKVKQTSRKNKIAWRKNIDLDVFEQSLEKQRAIERIGEEPIHQDTKSSFIFIEDRKGDEGIPSIRSSRVRKGLRSLESLKNNTSSVELISRLKKKGDAASTSAGLTPEQRALRAGMSKKDIEKLRRKAGKDVKGAFGVVVEEQDPKSRGVEAVIVPGTYDVWNGDSSSNDTKGKKKASSTVTNEGVGSWDEHKEKKDIQLPASFRHATKKIKSIALPLPKPGQSYNPAAKDHEALLNRAIEEMQIEEEQKKKEMEWKKAWDMGAKEARGKGQDEVEDLVGLKVGRGEVDDEKEAESESEIESDDGERGTAAAKEIKRKTKQQKTKQKKVKEELRARMNLKASKRSLSDLQSLRSLKKQLIQMEKENTQSAEKKRLAKEKRRDERVGVYKLPKQQEEVQLGEDLAEGLRTLKPEGNLLKDRVHSFHKHGIVEPKKRDPIGKRKGGSMRGKKEYESHAYKRFS